MHEGCLAHAEDYDSADKGLGSPTARLRRFSSTVGIMGVEFHKRRPLACDKCPPFRGRRSWPRRDDHGDMRKGGTQSGRGRIGTVTQSYVASLPPSQLTAEPEDGVRTSKREAVLYYIFMVDRLREGGPSFLDLSFDNFLLAQLSLARCCCPKCLQAPCRKPLYPYLGPAPSLEHFKLSPRRTPSTHTLDRGPSAPPRSSPYEP